MTYSYEEVIEKIENARRFGNQPGVEVTAQALKNSLFCDWKIPYIHVAGTNGKGSTCAFLNSIFQKAGMKTGMFTSPHLICFEERIMVNGAYISKEDVTRLGNILLNTDFGVSLTMFDYCLLMAVLYFAEQKVEIAIMETGLGGRLDATNALGNPIAAVITKIGFDHTDILGDTLEKIAIEKAGIIKKGSIVVSQRQVEAVSYVLNQTAQDKQASEILYVTEADMREVQSMKPHLQGDYQFENGASAMLCAKVVAEKLNLPEMLSAIPMGIKAACWQGRMEILSEEPFFMIDGAHNGHGVQALCNSLKLLYPGEKFHFCMGVMADKDYLIMIKEILPLAIDFVTVTPESNRALQAKELARQIEQAGVPAKSISQNEENGKNHLSLCFENLDKEHKTIAFGSLYFIGDLKAAWMKKNEQ